GVGGALLLGVAADRGAGAAADLGDAQPDDLFPDLLALAGGDNHAGVGAGNPGEGADGRENLVADAVGEVFGVDVVGLLQRGGADGVGGDSVGRLKVLGVHQSSRELVFVQLQPEQDAQPHVVDAAFHRPVHRLGVVGVVVFGAGGV